MRSKVFPLLFLACAVGVPVGFAHANTVTFVNDTFTGTDGTSLSAHTGETGASWTVGGALSVGGNRLYSASGGLSKAVPSGTPSSPDYSVQAVFYFPQGAVSGTYPQIRGRQDSVGGDAGYGIVYSGDGGAFYMKKGANTNIGNPMPYVPTVGESVTVKLVMQGTQISAYINGTLQQTVTDSDYTAAGYPAIYHYGSGSATTGVLLDSFVASETTPYTAHAADGAPFHYSPYNWRAMGDGSMQTANSAAYVKFQVSGTQNLLVSSVSTGSRGRAAVRIDGGAAQIVTLNTGDTVLASGMSTGTHSVTVQFVGADATPGSGPSDRWNTPDNVWRVSAFKVDDAGSISAPSSTLPTRIIFYGDSITEGYNADSDSMVDGLRTVGVQVAEHVGGEYGAIGFSGQGYAFSYGYGNIPKMVSTSTPSADTWNKYDSAHARVTGTSWNDGAPDYVFSYHGQNDGGISTPDIDAAVTAWITRVRAAAPAARIVLVVPYSQTAVAGITQAVQDYKAAHPSEHKLFLIDLGSAGNAIVSAPGGTADGLHPTAASNDSLAALVNAAVDAQGIIATPLAAGTITVSNATQSAVTLSATEATGGTAPYTYTWYRDATPGFTASSSNLVAGATGRTLTDSSLTAGTTYYYRIVYQDADGTAATSSAVSATTAAVASIQPVIQSTRTVSGGNAYPVALMSTTPTLPTVPSQPAGTTFTHDLYFGMHSTLVRALQQYLNAHGYVLAASGPGSPGNETTVYGYATRAAVAKLQASNGITPAAGYFGPLTRSYVANHP